MDFIPDEYQCEVTMMIKQCQSSSVESAPAAIESAPLPSQPSFDADYAETRRRQRATRLPRPLSPAFSSPPVTRSRRHQGESGEEESSAIPSDVTRFFEQARRDISSDEIYQQFINAQHDMYHSPDMNRWLKYPAYVLDIKEIYDNSASREGFGVQLEYPVPKE